MVCSLETPVGMSISYDNELIILKTSEKIFFLGPGAAISFRINKVYPMSPLHNIGVSGSDASNRCTLYTILHLSYQPMATECNG